MIKLQYDKMNINVGKLHQELRDTITQDFLVTHNDTDMFLTFLDIKEVKTDILDENEEVIDTQISYQKKSVSTVTEVNEETGEETPKEVIEWLGYDFAVIDNAINQVVANHDPTPDYEKMYQDKTKDLIREQYTIEQEIGLTNDCNMALMAGEPIPQAYIDYRNFVENCKDTAYLEVFEVERP